MSMSFTGKVENGVIVLPPGVHLPEGAEVEVTPREPAKGSAGIEKTGNVCGGDACIAHTRIPVWVIEQHRRLGATDEDLLADHTNDFIDFVDELIRAFPGLVVFDYVMGKWWE